MTVKSRIETNTVKAKEDFTLEIPEQFNVTPLAVVAMPKKYKAEIFTATLESRHHDGKTVEGFRIVIRRKDGSIWSRRGYTEPGADASWHCRSPLDVRNDLIMLTSILTPKKKTNTVVEDEDED